MWLSPPGVIDALNYWGGVPGWKLMSWGITSADGEQTLELFPWKIWQLKSDPTQGVNPGIGFFQPPSNAESLMATFDKWEVKADDATGIPRYTYGNEHIGGAGDTATGLSMLMNSAAKGLRRAIGNIDANVIGPTIGMTFINEMLYNPDESIKGDCVPVPRGAAAILIRESAQQRRMQFLTMTANPIDQQLVGGKYRLALLRETAAAMELPVDEVVPSDEAFEAQQAAQAQAVQQQQQQMLQMEAAQEDAVAQREMAAENTRLRGDIVKQVLTATLKGGGADQGTKPTSAAPTKSA